MTERLEGPAAGHGHLRAAHADRDRVVAALKAAFVQGRLNKDELDARVGQALASRTYAELAALTADLPAGPADVPAAPVAAGTAGAEPVRTPGQTMAKAAYRSAICLLLTVALVEGAFLFSFGGFLVLAIYTFMAFTGFLGYGVSDALLQRRARRRLPPAGRGGQDGRDVPGLEGRPPGPTGPDPSGVRVDQNRAEVRAQQDRRSPSGRGIPAPRGAGPVPDPA